jgi:alpha-beta hydrolase superfamily lysophospholipase
LAWAACVWLGCVAAGPVGAQDADDEEATSTEAEDKYLEGSSEHTVLTADGVYLSVRLWNVKSPTQNEVPIVMLLHMRGRTQRDWFPFAKYLNEKGFAVCTFDFRGHGESRDVAENYRPVAEAMKEVERLAETGVSRPVIPQGDRQRPADGKKKKTIDKIDQTEAFRSGKELAYALPLDVQAVKDFLVLQHNQGQFNLRRLGIVSAEMGSLIALEWMTRSEFKTGRQRGFEVLDEDLAALVILTPSMSLAGFRPSLEFNERGNEIPVMMYSSSEGKSAEEAERLARKLRLPERKLMKEEGDKSAKSRVRGKERPNSGWFKLESKLVGTELLRPPIEKLDQNIAGFLKNSLTKGKDRDWQKRDVEPIGVGVGVKTG